MGKRKNPAAARDGSEVGGAAASSPRSDLTPLRSDLKKGARYLLHFRYGDECEAPDTEAFAKRAITVLVIGRGRGWIDERTWTFDRLGFDNVGEAVWHPVVPRGFGWTLEKTPAAFPRSSSWRRRRTWEVPR